MFSWVSIKGEFLSHFLRSEHRTLCGMDVTETSREKLGQKRCQICERNFKRL
jgi:hypothetical protein